MSFSLDSELLTVHLIIVFFFVIGKSYCQGEKKTVVYVSCEMTHEYESVLCLQAISCLAEEHAGCLSSDSSCRDPRDLHTMGSEHTTAHISSGNSGLGARLCRAETVQ